MDVNQPPYFPFFLAFKWCTRVWIGLTSEQASQFSFHPGLALNEKNRTRNNLQPSSKKLAEVFSFPFPGSLDEKPPDGQPHTFKNEINGRKSQIQCRKGLKDIAVVALSSEKKQHGVECSNGEDTMFDSIQKPQNTNPNNKAKYFNQKPNYKKEQSIEIIFSDYRHAREPHQQAPLPQSQSQAGQHAPAVSSSSSAPCVASTRQADQGFGHWTGCCSSCCGCGLGLRLSCGRCRRDACRSLCRLAGSTRGGIQGSWIGLAFVGDGRVAVCSFGGDRLGY